MPNLRRCKTHGLTDFVHEKSGRHRCKKCRLTRVNNYRWRLKKELVDNAGGKCSECGYDRCLDALVFHHHNKDKENNVSRLVVYSKKEKAILEAKKCILLCANCHAEAHYDKSRESAS